MVIIYFNSVQWWIAEWNRPCNVYYETNISRFVFFRTLWLVFHTLLTNTCSKLKVETLICCGQSQQLKHQYDVMLYLFLTFNTCRWIYCFLLLTLNMYLSVGHGIKPTKQLKCTWNNMAVSLKHAHLTGVMKGTK